MAERKKSADFLPEFIRSEKNKKFLSSTLDPLIASPELERIDGFIGSKIFTSYDPKNDFYLKQSSKIRNDYSLEPATIFRDEKGNITDVVAYDDIINQLSIYGVDVSNLDKVFRTEYYSFNPPIDWDKLVNYDQYYWLVEGPSSIAINNQFINVFTSILGQKTYTYVQLPVSVVLSNGMKLVFSHSQTSGSITISAGIEYIVEGVGEKIKLIKFSDLQCFEPFLVKSEETFDSTIFDDSSFDSDQYLPSIPEYISINRSSKDLNPWSRSNRWFHRDVIETSFLVNNQIPVFPSELRAKRPIVEFLSDLQLYNFGNQGIKAVDLIEELETDLYADIQDSIGYYIDGISLEPGQRVIFNNDTDPEVRGKIFNVSVFLDYNGIERIKLTLSQTPSHNNSINIKSGTKYRGTSWYYDSDLASWKYSQQHFKINDFPLFDLFDSKKVSYQSFSNTFRGSKIFNYDIGSGQTDSILGFPVNSRNSFGIGSFVFKNYFMTDIISSSKNNISEEIPTSTTFYKINGDSETFLNIWAKTDDYQLSHSEIQIVESTTSSIIVKSLDFPFTTSTKVVSYVNNIKTISTATYGENLIINFGRELIASDVLTLKITSTQIPNANGTYEIPFSLSNNPLNGPISEMSLSELTDHVFSMVDRLDSFTGQFPGKNNLRDLYNYGKLGTKFIVSSNPIVFANIFLGKLEHNLIHSLRFSSDQYSQFKSAFYNSLNLVNGQMTPADAVDEILEKINYGKDLQDSFYRSDMLGYGNDKREIEYVVRFVDTIEYPFNEEFNLTNLSFKSVLVYVNDIQQVVGVDYKIDTFNESIVFISSLNLDDTIKIVVYSSTKGCYIPSTPTKLGLYPKYQPKIISDSAMISSSANFIQGHDGSLTLSYNDYRDNIVLELEKRIYNNIKVNYNPKLFDIFSVLPGFFRENKFSKEKLNELLQKEFIRWTSFYSIDYKNNSIYDESNSFTLNFKNGIEPLKSSSVFGNWRGLYRYMFDTDRPHTHPWEILGHQEKPDWWDNHYSWNVGRANMISAMVAGRTEEPPSTIVNPKYARPGFASIVPVDSSSNLINPTVLFLLSRVYEDRRAEWEFGDFGPAETVWRKSSNFPFALNILAALVDPCGYSSKLYDVSRTSLNILNQITYLKDDLYLNPKKLYIESKDDVQISGFGNFVYEHGRRKNLNYISNLEKDISYLTFNLFNKIGGFISKDKIQISIDSIDPSSYNQGSLLANQDYDLILNIGNPIKVSTISGVIIQKKNAKFVIKGYDREYPYFPIHKTISNSISAGITVGGVSASFSDWSNITNNNNSGLSSTDLTSANSTTSRYYKQGQIVRYNNIFYRVKIGHSAQSTFDPSLFERLVKLPVEGGASVSMPSGFESKVTLIPYGQKFNTIQEVYNFILGYGKYLENQGFIFEEYNEDLGEILDWKFSAKEFLYWTTQNWSDNSVITLSPFANSLKFKYPNSTVDDVSGKVYEYSFLKADGTLFPKENFEISREDTLCYIQTVDTEEGIFFAKLYSVQKEHGIVLKNKTLFNDTIFNIETGYKQRRVKLSGFRTKNWNGDFFSPGFIFDVAEIEDWKQFSHHLAGDVVRFNGSYFQSKAEIEPSSNFNFDQWIKLSEKPVPDLLPNFDYKINQFEDFYSLDIDNFDQSQQQLAQHLIGYTPRPYLNDLFSNPISQYKFYQGYIKEKGTKNALDKLSKAKSLYSAGELEIKELWAVRIGDFGGFGGYAEIETPLVEGSEIENPYVVKFVDSVPLDPNPLIKYNLTSELIHKPIVYDSTNVFSSTTGTFTKNSLELQVAGYISPDDVNYTAYNKTSLLDIANNKLIKKNETVWLGFLENGDWQLYRYKSQPAKISGVFVSLPGSEITFSTDKFHNLNIGDIISVVRFNDQVNGVYIVNSIPTLNQFSVSSSLTTIINEELLAFGSLFKFEKGRFSNFIEWSRFPNLLDFSPGEKIWIDSGFESNWQVYEKVKNFSSTFFESIGLNLGQQLGKSIYIEDDSTFGLFGLPGWKVANNPYQGKVWVLKRNFVDNSIEKIFDYSLNVPGKYYSLLGIPTEFGFSTTHDIKKNLYIVGAPAAGLIRAPSGLVVFSTGTGTARLLQFEGVVKISTLGDNNISEKTLTVIAHPEIQSRPYNDHSRFGHSLYINKVVRSQPTTLLIGAPGDEYNTGTGAVYAYTLGMSSSTLLVNSHPNGFILGNGTGVKSVGLTTGSNTVSLESVSVGFSSPQLPGGTTATAVVVKTGNTVTSVTITNPGSGYTSSPVVTFRSNSGQTGTGYVVMYDTSVSLTVGSRFGSSIVGNSNGTIIAVSAPGYSGISTGTGIVQIFDGNLQFIQAIECPILEFNKMFGESLAMSSSGKFLAISSKELRISSFESYGKVFLYKLDYRNLYVLTQTINNPTSNFDLKFGHSISFSPDETTLVISALGTNRNKFTTFDKKTKSGETLFDGGTTRFTYPIKDSGEVFVYSNFEDNFILSEDLSDTEILVGSRFGDYLHANNNDIYVGATSLNGAGIKTIKLVSSVLSIPENDVYTITFSQPDLGTGFPTVVPVYSNYVNNTKDLTGLLILYSGEGYQSVPSAYLRNPSGNIIQNLVVTIESDDSRVYRFSKKDKSINGFKLLKSQSSLVDVTKIKRVALFDNKSEEIIEYLDIYDPVKGKIHGIAEQELSFKSTFDPAVYTIGTSGSIVDTEISWIDEHVGELWWDLSTAKYIWYEQSDDIYRKNNWGKLFPGASIDIYEWVKSDILPSEWAIEADTNEGITQGISGQPKYPDNSCISIKQVFNNVTGSFENVYYFWVKNKVTLPSRKNRKISSYQVASIISDPAATGLKYASLLSSNSIALTNVNNLLKDNDISLNIISDLGLLEVPRHTEWLLMHEGDTTGIPSTLLEKKLFDSLLGHDFAGRPVPDVTLNSRNRYGLGVRPQQSLFKNRFEALRNIVDFANEILSKNIITGNFSFENLLKKDLFPNEEEGEYDFVVEDSDILDEIETSQLVQAKIGCYISNGKITEVVIVNSGFGYKFAPRILIEGEFYTSIISSQINDLGQIIKLTIENPSIDFDTFDVKRFVNDYKGNFSYELYYSKTLNILPLYNTSNEFSTDIGTRYGLNRDPDYDSLKYWVDKSFDENVSIDDIGFRTAFFYAVDVIDSERALVQEKSYVQGLILKDVRPHSVIVLSNKNFGFRWTKHSFNYEINLWIKTQSQGYITEKFWKYINWEDISFNEFKKPRNILENVFELDSLIDVNFGEYIKVKNYFNGNFAIFEKIQVGETTNFNSNWKIVFFQNGTIEILDSLWNYGTGFDAKTLEENLYDEIPDLEIYYILLALKDNIFIRSLKENWNRLFFRAIKYALTEQKMLDWAFKTSLINVFNKSLNLNQSSLYRITDERSIEEYISEIKPYHSVLTNYRSIYGSLDDASIFSTDFDLPPIFNSLTNKFETVGLTNSLIDSFPWKSWKDNYKYIVEKVKIADPGEGYTELPSVDVVGGGPTDFYDIADGDPYLKGGGITTIELTRSGKGYTSLPKINITGGGNFVKRNATASAILGGSPVRKNILSLKFDRIDAGTEIGPREVTDRFICDGSTVSFETSWLVDPDKLSIRPLLDGGLILSVDYKIEYYTKKYNNYNKRFSKFTFLNYVPLKNQILRLTYNKHIDLYKAEERINLLYNPTDLMIGKEKTLLMEGFDYSETRLEGLLFDYSSVWGGQLSYDNFVWSDLTDYYASAKIIVPVSTGSFTIVLNTTTGIVPGQILNVRSTTTNNYFRTGTVVESVSGNVVTLSSPTYQIKKARSTSTYTGSEIIVETKVGFFGDIVEGDRALVSGITSVEYNGFYIIDKILGNNKFRISAINNLTTTRASLSVGSKVKIYNILKDIEVQNIVLDSYIFTISNTTITNTSSLQLITFANYNDVSKHEIYVESPSGNNFLSTNPDPYLWYSYSESVEIPGRAEINVMNLNTGSTTTLWVTLLGDPKVEFWKNNIEPRVIDSMVMGGTWVDKDFMGARGISPEDIIIDGDSFLSPYIGHAPEEHVKGHVADSVSINVYTKDTKSNALIITGSIPINETGTSITHYLSLDEKAIAGIRVTFNGINFDRNLGDDFTQSNQFFLEGKRIIVPPQTVTGRLGYTIIIVGGDDLIDGNSVTVEGYNIGSALTTATVYSLASINDVQSAWVTLNGAPLNRIFTNTDYGYMLEPFSKTSDRASVKVYNMSYIQGEATIDAWFFRKPMTNFNTFREQYITVGISSSTFLLDPIPGIQKPVSNQIIVESSQGTGNLNDRKRLTPPWVTYYKVTYDQNVYSIPNIRNWSTMLLTIDTVKVYVNGIAIRSGFDWGLDSSAQTITVTKGLLANGDVLAIEVMLDCDYSVLGNNLVLSAASTSTSTIKVTSFTSHDNMTMKVERFKTVDMSKRFTLSTIPISESYIWVTVGGRSLIANVDYDILEDGKTIQISDYFNRWGIGDEIIVTFVAPPNWGNRIIGYKVFKDIFENTTYHRLSKAYSTVLAKDTFYDEKEIEVRNANSLIAPNPGKNIPGIVFIDGERIEFSAINGNKLVDLRRGTLGTGPSSISLQGTRVIDQSLVQTIPMTGFGFTDFKVIQNITSTNTTTYIISTVTSIAGPGIILKNFARSVDQVEVFYGGRKLRKNSIDVHDQSLAYDSTSSIIINETLVSTIKTLPPEFTINTGSDQVLVLNIPEIISSGTRITVIMNTGTFWQGTESMLTGNSSRIKFLQSAEAELPDEFYYGGESTLLDQNGNPLTNDDGTPLLGY